MDDVVVAKKTKLSRSCCRPENEAVVEEKKNKKIKKAKKKSKKEQVSLNILKMLCPEDSLDYKGLKVISWPHNNITVHI